MIEYIAIGLFTVYSILINVQLFTIKRSVDKLLVPPSKDPQQKILSSSKRVLDY